MISEEHKLAIRLIQIRRDETLFKQRSLTDEPFNTHWIREAIKLIETHKQKWEKQAVENYKHEKRARLLKIGEDIKIK